MGWLRGRGFLRGAASSAPSPVAEHRLEKTRKRTALLRTQNPKPKTLESRVYRV